MDKKEAVSNLSAQVTIRSKGIKIAMNNLPQEAIEVVKSLAALKEGIGIKQITQNEVCVFEQPYHIVFGIPIDGEYKEFAICRREDIRKGTA